MSKAVVLYSGGQDSTACLLYALKMFDEVVALSINYKQAHLVELSSASTICDKLGVHLIQADMSFIAQISHSPLLMQNRDVKALSESVEGPANSVVPNRNQFFLTAAHTLAQNVGADTVIAGMCFSDEQGFPDCRPQYLRCLANATNLGSGKAIRFVFPVLHLTKAETIALATRLHPEGFHIITQLTHTCYAGVTTPHEWGMGCGECIACKGRIKGYYDYSQAK